MDTLAHTTLARARLALAGLVLGGAALLGGAGEADGEVVDVESFGDDEVISYLQNESGNKEGEYQVTLMGGFTVDGQEDIKQGAYHIGFGKPIENTSSFRIIGYADNFRNANNLEGKYYGNPDAQSPEDTILLAPGETPSSVGEGLNGKYGIFCVCDYNDDGSIGSFDKSTGLFTLSPEDKAYLYSGNFIIGGERGKLDNLPEYNPNEGGGPLPSINIDTTYIPEVSTLGLLAAGGLAGLLRRRKARREAR